MNSPRYAWLSNIPSPLMSPEPGEESMDSRTACILSSPLIRNFGPVRESMEEVIFQHIFIGTPTSTSTRTKSTIKSASSDETTFTIPEITIETPPEESKDNE